MGWEQEEESRLKAAQAKAQEEWLKNYVAQEREAAIQNKPFTPIPKPEILNQKTGFAAQEEAFKKSQQSLNEEAARRQALERAAEAEDEIGPKRRRRNRYAGEGTISFTEET
jgi:hypothetical protein